MNPEFPDMMEAALDRGFEVLVLTNAMRPMMRPGVQARLLRLNKEHAGRLLMRVSLDHYTRELHEAVRGKGTWSPAIDGLRWLASHKFDLSVAGRARWGEPEAETRTGYEHLFRSESIPCNPHDAGELVLFPEMSDDDDVPEITVDCWDLVGVRPQDVMCAGSRMVVKRRGAASPTVVACTLLPYESEFELGANLVESLKPVALNHPHCARFCVLGGGSCSVGRVEERV
jgi:hypothetical protein